MSGTNRPSVWRIAGPGIAVAATGVGAGDLVAAAVSGAHFGTALLWTAIAGAILKLALTDGIARWQLTTGQTLVAGWVERLGRPVAFVFGGYLVLWTLFVGSALMAVCGLAVHAVLPAVPVIAGAVLHGLAGLVLVLAGRYQLFESSMKGFIGLMFVTIVGASLLSPPSAAQLASGLVPRLPAGALPDALAVLGGVGGTVTLLSYGYWIREKGWHDLSFHPSVRVDLLVAYGLTGIFAVAVIALAATVLGARGLEVKGNEAALTMAEMLGERAGAVGRGVFLAGFWGAVASSLLGVWQGVPYLFAELWGRLRGAGDEPVDTRSAVYRGYLVFLTLAPMAFLFLEPVGLVRLYAALGALFMPFLAVTLLIMLNRGEWMGGRPNGRGSNLLLVLSVALFAGLGIRKLVSIIGALAGGAS